MSDNFTIIEKSQSEDVQRNFHWDHFCDGGQPDSQPEMDSKHLVRTRQHLNSEHSPNQQYLVSKINAQIPLCDERKILKKPKMNQHLFKHVFEKKQCQKKNTNFIKFLVAAFTKNIKTQSLQISEEHSKFLQAAKKKYEKKGKRYIQMDALELLFGQDDITENFKSLNRRNLFQFLGSQEFLIQNIVFSKFITKQKNKKQHLLASKIYRLRCRSFNLSQRVQTK